MVNIVLLLAEELGNKEFFNVQDVQEIMRDNMVATGTASRLIWELKDKDYKYEAKCLLVEQGLMREDILNKDIIPKSDLIRFAKIMLESINEFCGIDPSIY